MNDFIEIQGIAGFGYHGLFEHERNNGQSFSVDIKLELEHQRAQETDSIADTVDYSHAVVVVYEFIVGKPVNLIERLAEMIAAALLEIFAVKSVEVVVHKANAPVGFPVGDIAIRIKREK